MVASQIQGDEDSDDTIPTQTSSMVPNLPGRQHELDIMKWVLDIDDSAEDILDWPPIDPSPVNEYTIEGLFDIAFLALFLNGVALPMQAWMREAHIQEYVLYLIRYYDQRFGRHHRFHYFFHNMMNHHCSHRIATIFVKENIDENIQTTIENLCIHLTQPPHT